MDVEWKKVRAAVYCRVSTEEQSQAETIENQVEFARKYCELHGIQVVEWYKDDGVSGSIPLEERPEGRRLLEDAGKKKFNLLLVYRIDRLARKTLHLLTAYEKLEALGVGLRSMTEAFDTATPAGKFTMTMFASIAALERETILERTALGKERKLRQGRWAGGGKPPLGYVVNEEGYLEIEPKEAEIVRTIFSLYVEEGMSTLEIADYLTAKGTPLSADFKGTHPNHRDRWPPSRIARILSNTTYKGEHRYHRHTPSGIEVIATHVPPIVSEEIWQRAEELRRNNKKEAWRNAKRAYLLRGLIRCGECGLAYVGDGAGRKRKYFYYRCTGSRNSNRTLDRPCTSKALRADEIEELIWRDIQGFIRNPGDIMEKLEARLKEEKERRKPVEEELIQVEKSIARKKEDRQRVINLYRRGLIGDAEVEEELISLQKEIASLQERRDSLLNESFRQQALEAQTANARILLERLRDKAEDPSWDTKRELVETLVESIVVHTLVENGRKVPKITVRYRFVEKNSDSSSGVFGPRNPKISPERTSRSRPSTAGLMPPR